MGIKVKFSHTPRTGYPKVMAPNGSAVKGGHTEEEACRNSLRRIRDLHGSDPNYTAADWYLPPPPRPSSSPTHPHTTTATHDCKLIHWRLLGHNPPPLSRDPNPFVRQSLLEPPKLFFTHTHPRTVIRNTHYMNCIALGGCTAGCQKERIAMHKTSSCAAARPISSGKCPLMTPCRIRRQGTPSRVFVATTLTHEVVVV